MYDVDNNEISPASVADAARLVFNVKLEMRINGFSFNAVEATAFDLDVTAATYYPAIKDDAAGIAPDAVASSAPLGGHFTIKCTDPNSGVETESREFTWGW